MLQGKEKEGRHYMVLDFETDNLQKSLQIGKHRVIKWGKDPIIKGSTERQRTSSH